MNLELTKTELILLKNILVQLKDSSDWKHGNKLMKAEIVYERNEGLFNEIKQIYLKLF